MRVFAWQPAAALVVVGLFWLTSSVQAANEPAIIPQPQKLERLQGVFKATPDLVIVTDQASKDTGEYLGERLRPATGYAIRTSLLTGTDSKPRSGAVILSTENARKELGAEGYELSVTPELVVISAPNQAGMFYGVQTVLQLLPPEVLSARVVRDIQWEIPCVKITDAPRYSWRGLMVDVSRHFFTKEEIKSFLDVMALHKLNTFHWHMVDDHGWRIEIAKYPRLTSVGAWRKGVGFGFQADATTAYDKDGRYGGFYTKQEIRDIVAYAKKLHITVVPEIEMPGHSLAALSAYPEFGAGPGPFEIPQAGGVFRGIYSPAKPESLEFLQDVLKEVFELFPSRYVHIGGDEVPKQPWKNDPACQELMKKEGLKTEQELQSWFTRRMEKFLDANGKTLIGWSEIRQGGLSDKAVLMDWIGGGREAASTGHDVVMSPTAFCYFNEAQSRNRQSEPRSSGAFVPLKRVYSFEPTPANLAPDNQRHILGAQGNLWTEYVPNMKVAQYMTFPRELAMAEVVWSPKEVRDYDSFLRRLKTDEHRLDMLGVSYRNSALGDDTESQTRPSESSR